MPGRINSYSVFTVLVELVAKDQSRAVGGFWGITGLPSTGGIANYRPGNEPPNHPIKLPGLRKYGDVTLKRGIVDSGTLWDWFNAARTSQSSATNRSLQITLRDETGQPVSTWKLNNAAPKHWTGPTLSAKGGSDFAIEELILAHEGLELVEPQPTKRR